MSDCIHCKCDDVPINKDTCTKLQSDNTNKLRDFSIYYRDLQTCNLAEEGAKGFYNVWCMFKNLIAYVCWLTANIKKFNAGPGISLIEEEDKTITIKANLDGYVTKEEFDKVAGALQKVLLHMASTGQWTGYGENIFDGKIGGK